MSDHGGGKGEVGQVDFIWQWFPAELAADGAAEGMWVLWPMEDYLENRLAVGDAAWSAGPDHTPHDLLQTAQHITGRIFSAIEPAQPRPFRFASDPSRTIDCATYALINAESTD